MKQSHIREWEKNKRLIILSGHLFLGKKQEKIKTKDRNARYKFKSKLVLIRRNIQRFTGTVGTIMKS